MKITVEELRSKIAEICKTYSVNRHARKDALKKLQWVLVIDGWPVQDESGALIFDGRDNEEMKVRYYKAISGREVEIHLVESGKPCLCSH